MAITVDDVIEDLGKEAADTDNRAVVERCFEAAKEDFEELCGVLEADWTAKHEKVVSEITGFYFFNRNTAHLTSTGNDTMQVQAGEISQTFRDDMPEWLKAKIKRLMARGSAIDTVSNHQLPSVKNGSYAL